MSVRMSPFFKLESFEANFVVLMFLVFHKCFTSFITRVSPVFFNGDQFWAIHSNSSFIDLKIVRLDKVPSSGMCRAPVLFLKKGKRKFYKQEMELLLLFYDLLSKNFFYKIFPITTKDSGTVFLNKKYNLTSQFYNLTSHLSSQELS